MATAFMDKLEFYILISYAAIFYPKFRRFWLFSPKSLKILAILGQNSDIFEKLGPLEDR